MKGVDGRPEEIFPSSADPASEDSGTSKQLAMHFKLCVGVDSSVLHSEQRTPNGRDSNYRKSESLLCCSWSCEASEDEGLINCV